MSVWFPLAPRYAELYTLRVAEQARAIAVMPGNTDALRFYARRGLVPGELLLCRFRAARAIPRVRPPRRREAQ